MQVRLMHKSLVQKYRGICSIFISVIVLILMLTLMEFGFGLVLDDNRSADLSHDKIKRHIRLREHVPRSTMTFRGEDTNAGELDYPEPGPYQIRIDENGFIRPSAVHEDPDLKIFFLGGSSTECLYMKEEERFPYLVGRHFERNGLKINSYNGGVSGNNSMHSINILLNKVLPMEPDFVVLMHNINDLTPLMYYGTYWNSNSTRSLVVDQGDQSPLQHLYEAVKITARGTVPNSYQILKRARDRFGQNTESDEWQDIRTADLDVDEDQIEQAFRRSLLTFVHVAKVHSFVPILMTQARRADLSDAPVAERSRWILRTKLFDEFNEIIRQVGRSQDIHIIDLDRTVPKDIEYMYDSLHFTPKGSDFVAKTIARYFEDNLLPN